MLLSVLAEKRGARHQSIPLLAAQDVGEGGELRTKVNNKAVHEDTNADSETCIVFCETKLRCAEVASILNQHGAGALALHGDLEQSDRERVSSIPSDCCMCLFEQFI